MVVAKRVDNPDGSSSFASKWSLPTDWDTKLGVDFTLPEEGAVATPAGAAETAGAGAAWASLSVPDRWLPVWEKASLDARIDPYGAESRLSTTFSRTLAAGRDLALTVAHSIAVTHSDAAPEAADAVSGGGSVNVRLLSTATTLSAGTTLSSAGELWSATLSAGQTLFGGIQLNAALSESESGAGDRRIGASYRRRF